MRGVFNPARGREAAAAVDLEGKERDTGSPARWPH